MERDSSITLGERPGVFRPSEDSDLLLAALEVRRGERFLDIGAGSGFLALHAARVARAVATDVSPDAVRLIRENAHANRLPLAVVRCDLFRGLRGAFDVIAFNPPYLVERISGDWTDRAWQGGPEGDEVILRFLRDAAAFLAPGGRAYLLVPSQRDRGLAAAEERFHVRVAGERPLFFERLLVLELTHRD